MFAVGFVAKLFPLWTQKLNPDLIITYFIDDWLCEELTQYYKCCALWPAAHPLGCKWNID